MCCNKPVFTETGGRTHLVHGLESTKPCVHSFPPSQVAAAFSLKPIVPTVTSKILSPLPNPFLPLISCHQITPLTTPPCCHSSTDSLNNLASGASPLPSSNASPIKVLRNCHFYEHSPKSTLCPHVSLTSSFPQ